MQSSASHPGATAGASMSPTIRTVPAGRSYIELSRVANLPIQTTMGRFRHHFTRATITAATVLSLTLGAAPAPAAAPTTRDGALAAFAQVTADAAVASGWTGSSQTCAVGTESQASLDATLRTLNLLRSFVDARAVSWDPALNQRALAAASLMLANGQLDHFPAADWRCYTELARSGASTSNLYLGRSGAAAMVGYVIDDGVDSLGHRFWALDPAAVTMGTGSTGGSNALTVIGNDTTAAPAQPMIAWPPAGFVPNDWLPQRWSATFAGSGSMAGVTPTMTMDGVAVPVASVTPHTAGYGSGTSVSWVPTLPDSAATGDHAFAVTLTGLAGGTVSYVVNGVSTDGVDLTNIREIQEGRPRPSFAARPRITYRGRLRAGLRLTALARTSNATRVTYQWERNGRVIRGQTRRVYLLRAADRGHRIRVHVRLAGPGGRSSMRSLDLRWPRATS